MRLPPRRLGLRALILRRLPRLRPQTLRLPLRQLLTAPTRGRWRGGRASILLLALLTCGTFVFEEREGALAKNQTYRAFASRPTHILDSNGELLDGAPVLASLAPEARDISAYATFMVRNDEALGGELAQATATTPAEAGRQTDVTMPDFLETGKSGRSRKERPVQYNVVTSCRSWQERTKVTNGESPKYVSQDWKRTADKSAPTYSEDYVNLGVVDKCYAAVEGDPFAYGENILRMVIQRAAAPTDLHLRQQEAHRRESHPTRH